MINERTELEKMLFEKVNELSAFCALNRIPSCVICAYEKEGQTEIVDAINTPMKLNVKLSNDKITPLLALIGSDKFKITPIQKIENYDENFTW